MSNVSNLFFDQFSKTGNNPFHGLIGNLLRKRIHVPGFDYYGSTGELSMIVLAFLDSMRVCVDLRSFVMPLLTFVKDMTKRSYTSVVGQFGKMLLNILRESFGHVTDIFNQIDKITLINEKLPAQWDSINATGFLKQFQSVINQKKLIMNSDFGKHVTQFCSLVICLPFFKKHNIDSTWFGFSELHKLSLERKFNSTHPLGIYESIIESTMFILEKSILLIETNNINSLYVSDKEFMEYDEEFNFISGYVDRLNLLANKNISLDEYYRRAHKCRDHCVRLMKFVDDPYMKTSLKKQFQILTRCTFKAEDAMHVRSEREPPFCFCIGGPPKIGKSFFIVWLLSMLCANDIALGRASEPYDSKKMYVVNPDDEFLSGFRSDMLYALLDDMDQYLTKILEADKGGPIRKLISFINPVPYITNQAELADKGMIPFLCRYVLLTSNTRDAGLSKVFRETGGAKRRITFIDLEVKEEYRVPGTSHLRGDIENPENYELYNISVRRYVYVDTGYNEEYFNVKENKWQVGQPTQFGKPIYFTLQDLAYFLKFEIQKKAYEQNDTAKQVTEKFAAKGVCVPCGVHSAVCKCSKKLPAQAGRFDIVSEAFNATCDTFNANVIPSYLSTIEMVFIVPIYICMVNLFDYHNDFLLHRIYIALPHVVTDERLWIVKYMPKRLKHYFVMSYWSQNYSLQNFFHNRSKSAKFIAYGVGIVITLYCLLQFIMGVSSSFKFMGHAFESKINEDDDYEVEGPKPNFNPTFTEISRVVGQQATTTMSQLKNIVKNNLTFLKIKFDEKCSFNSRALGISGNTIVLPAHGLIKKRLVDYHIDVIRCEVDKNLGPNLKNIHIGEECVTYDKNYDLLYITHPMLGPFRDLKPYFNNNLKGKCKGVMMKRQIDGTICESTFHGTYATDIEYESEDLDYIYPGYAAVFDEVPLPGDCGAPYLVETGKGSCIIGIHMAGGHIPYGLFGQYRQVTGYCLPIKGYDQIKPYVLEAHSFDGVDLNETYMTEQDLSIVQQLHYKDPIAKMAGAAIVYGALKIPRIKMKSMVRETIMCQDFLDFLGLLEPTHFSPRDVSSREALKLGLEPILARVSIPMHKVKMACEGLKVWYSRVISEKNLEIPNKPYDLIVGINGIDGDPHIKRLKLSTSGGFAHKGPKSKYFVDYDSLPLHEVCYMPCEEIGIEGAKMESRYEKGLRNNIVWDSNFKDEPLSADKIKKNKCRIFNSGPLAFMILVRRYFLWCIPLFAGKYRHLFGMAIGANCYGKDWNTIYNHITRHGKDRMIAGDYKSFDKGMSPEVMMGAFTVLINIAREHGWSERDITVMKGIATDICYPLTNCFGSLLEFLGSNPSGHPLTTPINSMVNIMYIMIACHDISQNVGKQIDLGNFLDYISIITYGDDNAMSSADDDYNHTSISEALAKYNVVYTMADKTSKSEPLISVYKLELLKRSFRPNLNMDGRIACPINLESVHKSGMVCVESSSIGHLQQCAEILDAGNRELFFHGKKKFKRYHRFFCSLVEKYNLKPYLAAGYLYSYKELYAMYCENKEEKVVPINGKLKAQSFEFELEDDLYNIIKPEVDVVRFSEHFRRYWEVICHIAFGNFKICDDSDLDDDSHVTPDYDDEVAQLLFDPPPRELLTGNQREMVEDWERRTKMKYNLPAQSFSSYETFANGSDDEGMSMGSLETELIIVTRVTHSYLLTNFGPRLRTVNINYLPGVSIQQFGTLCTINDALHDMIEETWLYHVGLHYNMFKYVLEDIRNLLPAEYSLVELCYDLDLESL